MNPPASAARPPPARAPTLAIVLLVRGGLRLGRQHARHRPLAGAACRHLRRQRRRGLDRGHRLPVRQRRVRAGARPVRRPLRQDAGGGHCLHHGRAVLPPERAGRLACLAGGSAFPDRRHQLGHHSAGDRLAGRQCQLRASPGDAGALPDGPDTRPDDRRRLRAVRSATGWAGARSSGCWQPSTSRRAPRCSASCAPIPPWRDRPAVTRAR